MLARGHVLLEGVPGVAKTLLVGRFRRARASSSRRVQFTPDLMPSTSSGRRSSTRGARASAPRGSVFTHVLLADEINRTPPKTQAALLEAMESAR